MQFTTFEVDLGPDGEARVELTIPTFGPDDERTMLLLVEEIDSDDGDFQAWSEGEGLEPMPSTIGSIRSFAGRLRRDVTRVTLGLSSGVRKRFRVFVGWVSRRLRQLMDRLPCHGCKTAIRAVLKAALAAVGIPLPNLTAIGLAADQIAELVRGEAFRAIVEFFAELFGDQAWKWLWENLPGWLQPIRELLDWEDRLYEQACEQLGLCP